jgi:adenine-specific DNA-methyltransferase
MTTYIILLHCADCGREEFIRTISAWHPRLDTRCRRCKRAAESEAQRLREDEIRRSSASQYEVELLGVDVFDPVEMKPEHRAGNDVPAWLLDTDYNGLCFHVSQAFFPRTSAWDNLKKALRGTYDEAVWDHLAGTVSAPFEAGDHGQIAVKVIDDRGNELMVVQKL